MFCVRLAEKAAFQAMSKASNSWQVSAWKQPTSFSIPDLVLVDPATLDARSWKVGPNSWRLERLQLAIRRHTLQHPSSRTQKRYALTRHTASQAPRECESPAAPDRRRYAKTYKNGAGQHEEGMRGCLDSFWPLPAPAGRCYNQMVLKGR